MPHILYIEDELDKAQVRLRILDRSGFQVTTLTGSEGLEEAVRAHDFDAVLLDNELRASSLNGLAILRWLQATLPELPVIFISDKSNYQVVVAAVKGGADDFLDKKDVPEILLAVLERTVSRYEKRRRRERDLLRKRGIFGNSPLMIALWQEIRAAARHRRPVTLTGPAGTEKKQLAETICQLMRPSLRGDFVVVTCRGASADSLSSELFGSRDHTSAPRSRLVGKIESAVEGTLFLDHIDAVPVDIQGELLEQVRSADAVRLIASTECGIKVALRRDILRKDLAEYVADSEIRIPSVHERILASAEDFRDLCDYLIETLGYETGLRPIELDTGARLALESYAWPGNLDELRELLGRLYGLGRTKVYAEDIEAALRAPGRLALGLGLPPFASYMTQIEELYYSDLLRIGAGDWTRMEQVSGLNRDKLRYYLNKYKRH
ncbi:sigma-54-dependent Fis family transcriptional regulator [candidate division KSB1 bacterium]|nr:sigma-54-dependent Fis family transcriptional regulator [candidate division KSB1 bacterium]